MHYAKLKGLARILSAKLRELLGRYGRIAGAASAAHLLHRPTELDLLQPRNSLRPKLATKSIAAGKLVVTLARAVIPNLIRKRINGLLPPGFNSAGVQLDLTSQPRINTGIGKKLQIANFSAGRANLRLVGDLARGVTTFINNPLPSLSR